MKLLTNWPCKCCNPNNTYIKPPMLCESSDWRILPASNEGQRRKSPNDNEGSSKECFRKHFVKASQKLTFNYHISNQQSKSLKENQTTHIYVNRIVPDPFDSNPVLTTGSKEPKRCVVCSLAFLRLLKKFEFYSKIVM